MQQLGLDLLSVLAFDGALAAMPARDFVEKILVGRHGISHIVCGYDFCFGHKRQGDVAYLKQMGELFEFDVSIIDPVFMPEDKSADAPYSSSVIREKLRQGHMRAAADLLGYWWHLSGPVVEGDRRGRTIGYPTANIHIDQGGWPRLGIYAVRVQIGDKEQSLPGVAYIGTRPTYDKQGVVLEVHLFDFSADIYGENLTVELIEFIRPDAAFTTTQELVSQMDEDKAHARAILADMDKCRPINKVN